VEERGSADDILQFSRSDGVPGESLVTGSRRVVFTGRPVIRSFLNDEVLRLLEDASRPEKDKPSPVAPVAKQRTGHSPEQVRRALAPMGLVPIWEYARIGLSLKDVQGVFPPQAALKGTATLSVMDCVSGICEYSLEGMQGAAQYRLYFRGNQLLSIVVAFAFEKTEGRLRLLERLKEFYGGRIWHRKVAVGKGNNVSAVEFLAEYRGMRIESLGSSLRVVSLD